MIAQPLLLKAVHLFFSVFLMISFTSEARARSSEKLHASKDLRELLAGIDRLRFISASDRQAAFVRRELEALDTKFKPLGAKLKAPDRELMEQQFRFTRSRLEDPALARAIPLSDLEGFSRDLWQAAMRAFAVDFGPSQALNLEKGGKLYQKHCAECHGASGAGDGILAKSLPKLPSRFDAQREPKLDAPLKTYTHLIAGQSRVGMPSFEAIMTITELWDLAFFVSRFRYPCEAEKAPLPGEASLPSAWTLRQISHDDDETLMQSARMQKSEAKSVGDAAKFTTTNLRCFLPYSKRVER